ncbi:hypothetical protein BH11BAC6_BH11BAC6_13500 [soil metagenome]
MKKIIILNTILFISLQLSACPFCGCGVGNFYMGLLPNFKNHFVGVRYQYMQYHTQLKDDQSQFSTDHYRTAELWSGLSLGSKFQLLGFVPYHINFQNTDDGIKKENGIGDITLIGNYKLFAKAGMKTSEKPAISQELWVGGGVKLPTGKYSFDPNDPEAEISDVNAQMGTGSVDFLLNSSYNLRINNFGVSTSATYKINTANNTDFNFGNRFTANSLGYYNISLHSVSIAPNAGVLYEHAAVNHLNNTKVELTGGYAALAVTGAEVTYKKINVGANIQLPFAQSFALGQTQARTRGMVHLTFSF